MLGAGGCSDPLSGPPSTIEGVRGPGLKMNVFPGPKGSANHCPVPATIHFMLRPFNFSVVLGGQGGLN